MLPALHKSMGVFLPLITTNCAILGVALINIQKNYTLWQSLLNAVSTAVGILWLWYCFPASANGWKTATLRNV